MVVLGRRMMVSALVAGLLVPLARGDEGPKSKPIALWPSGAPGASGDSDEDRPAITPYLPEGGKGHGAAVLVCPGGGFTTRAVDHEGVLVARWFQSKGVAAFLLRYRIRPVYTPDDALRDARRGLRYLRAHAEEFGVAPGRIGIIGFSAGANLAARAALEPSPGEAGSDDPVERVSGRPDFAVLAYGTAPRRGSADLASAPPTFLFCTTEDASQAGGMVETYNDLRKAGVPVEAHFFAEGEHGVGFALGDPVLGEWPALLLRWLRANGLLTDAKRVAIRGLVTIDGEPLPRGSVIFTPLDSTGAPPVVARVFNTGPVRGEFAVPASKGPTPGRYRVEVRQDATRWMSNARDPVLGEMLPKLRAGTLSEEDRRRWIAHARARDLSPSIDDQRVYRTHRPGDRDEMVVEIKGGDENRLDIDVSTKEAK